MNPAIDIQGTLLADFFRAAKKDPRVSTVHISLYMVLLLCYIQQDCSNPVMIMSSWIKPLAKVSGTSTYHKRMKELHAYGYIKYLPTFDRYEGSRVYLLPLK